MKNEITKTVVEGVGDPQYCVRKCAHKNTATNLIEPKMWHLCKQGMAGSMDGPPWRHRQAIRGCREMTGGPSVDTPVTQIFLLVMVVVVFSF